MTSHPMRPWPKVARRWAGVLAPLALAALVLPGCAGGGTNEDDVVGLGQLDATVSGDPSAGGDGGGEVTQKQRAEAMVNCLVAAGLPAILNDWQDEDNQAEASWDPEKVGEVAYASEEMGGSMCFSETGCGKNVVGDDFTPTAELPHRLMIDGLDYSAEYSTCWAESDYIEPVWHSDPVEELKQKQAQVEANNAWAACARQNGYPDLKDSPAPKPDDESWVEPILLPASITADQLRTLIEVCPNFNEDQATRMQDGSFDWENETSIPDPYVDFDWAWRSGSKEPTEAELRTHEELTSILWEKQQAFYEQAYPEDGAIGGGMVAVG